MLTLTFGINEHRQSSLTCGLRLPEVVHNLQEAYETLVEDADRLGVITGASLQRLPAQLGEQRIREGAEFEISFFRGSFQGREQFYWRVEDHITGSTTQSAADNLQYAFIAALDWLGY